MPQPLSPTAAPDWDRLAELVSVHWARLDEHQRLLTLGTGAGELRVTLGARGVRIRAEEAVSDDYGLMIAQGDDDTLTLNETTDALELRGASYALRVERQTLAMTVSHKGRPFQCSATDAHFTRLHRLPTIARVEGGWLVSLELRPGEAVYGLGEKWSALNRRGQWLRSWNHDALGVNSERSYKNTPFSWSPRGWGVFVHTPAAVTHAVGFAPWSQRAYVLYIEDSALDLTLFAGDSPASLIRNYCELTGFAHMPPDWSLGTILSRAYYRDADELLAAAREVRARNMPCDTITLDGRAWQDTRTRFTFDWDVSRYPDPARVIEELKALNFRVCLWEYPLVSVDGPLFKQLATAGWLIRDRRSGEPWRYHWDSSPFGEVLTPLPDSGIVDFTHPEAYAFWRDAHRPLFELGVDMIKADFGEQLDHEHMLAHNGDSGVRLHNAYSLLYNRCVFEAAQRYGTSGAFLFSRAGWSGSQRYPALWGGDPQADWEGLAASIRGALSWGLSGGPFYASDVGGFYGDTRDPELYVRWAQAAVFSAHLRLHGIGPREPWSYGTEAEAAVLTMLRLRYQLRPYLSASMREATATGLPVQRAMVLAFPEDPLSWAFDHQYLFGERLLVTPCIEAGGQIEFYLPAGDWYRFPDGAAYSGGQTYREQLALDSFAAFARAGDAIQLGPAVEHCGVQTSTAPVSWVAGRDHGLPT